MNRFRELERFPKILLIALVLLVVVFAPIYGITASRESRSPDPPR